MKKCYSILLIALVLFSGCKGEYFAEKDFYYASKLLKRAEQTGMYSEAIQAFEKLADKQPGTAKAPQSLLIAAELRLKQKDYAGALKNLEKVVQTYSTVGSNGVDARYRIAQVYEAQGKWREAEAAFWDVSEYHSLQQKGLYAPIYILMHYQKLKDKAGEERTFFRAKEHYESVLRQVGPIQASAAVRNYFAVAYLVHGKWRTAKDLWLALAKDMPNHPFAPISILAAADTLALNNNPEKAIGYYRRYLKKYPNHNLASKALVRIGMLHQNGKHYELARKIYERALRQYFREQKDREQAAELNLIIADSFKAEGRWSEAEAMYQKIQAQYPVSTASMQVPFRFFDHAKSSGQLAQANSILDKAMLQYQELIAKYAGTRLETQARRFLQSAYIRKEDWNGLLALIDVELGKEQNPVKQGQWLILKAIITEKRLQNKEKALALYRDFLAKYPDHPLANTAKQQQQILAQN